MNTYEAVYKEHSDAVITRLLERGPGHADQPGGVRDQTGKRPV